MPAPCMHQPSRRHGKHGMHQPCRDSSTQPLGLQHRQHQSAAVVAAGSRVPAPEHRFSSRHRRHRLARRQAQGDRGRGCLSGLRAHLTPVCTDRHLSRLEPREASRPLPSLASIPFNARQRSPWPWASRDAYKLVVERPQCKTSPTRSPWPWASTLGQHRPYRASTALTGARAVRASARSLRAEPLLGPSSAGPLLGCLHSALGPSALPSAARRLDGLDSKRPAMHHISSTLYYSARHATQAARS